MNIELNDINKLDAYTIKETIGQGTFSKVKLGINKETNAKVAIKFLEKAKIVEKEDLERINREMKIIQQMSNLNIIQVYEMFQTPEYYLIIMEYCEGGELFDYIVEKQRLGEEEAAFFFYQLINGIEYIHSLGIVHRDLKPENLLLSASNVLKIIDFGLSNYFNEELLSTPCGSPCYASPEMVSGNKYNGFFIDVWSSGIILYAMTCGYLPFEDEKNDLLFQKILQCKVYFPKHLSNKVKDLLCKIMNTNPQERITINEIKLHAFYLDGKRIFLKEQRRSTHFERSYLPFPTEFSNPILIKKQVNDNISTKPSYKANSHEKNKYSQVPNSKVKIKIPQRVYQKPSDKISKTEGNSKYRMTTVATQNNTTNNNNNKLSNTINNINILFPGNNRNQGKKKGRKNNFSHLVEAQLYLETHHNNNHLNSKKKTKRNVSTQRQNKQINSFKEKCPITINNAIINVNMIDPSMLYVNNNNNHSNRRGIRINEQSTRIKNPFSMNHYSILPTSPNVEEKLPMIKFNEQSKLKFTIKKHCIIPYGNQDNHNTHLKPIKITNSHTTNTNSPNANINTNANTNINTIQMNRKPIKIKSI